MREEPPIGPALCLLVRTMALRYPPCVPVFFLIFRLGVGMAERTGASVIYVFEDCSLDTARRELRRSADLVAVEPQVFDILRYLITQRERVVSKEDLIDAVWGGRFISESTFSSRLSAVRHAIGDRGEAQRLIRTIPRRGFRFVGNVREVHDDSSALAAARATTKPALALPEKPSIAVLPFTNMSGDPEQEYFADGMVEEIITELSRFGELLVIARNSTFQYKGKAVDVRQVGRDLGARYVMEGSVRRGADRIRIAVQLIDALTGGHMWAERYDRELHDIFAIQDEVVRRIVAILVTHLSKAEAERTIRKPPGAWEAYDFCIRAAALAPSYQSSLKREDLYEIRRLANQALLIDPDYARAHAILSFTYLSAWVTGIDSDYLNPQALDRASNGVAGGAARSSFASGACSVGGSANSEGRA
jgi:TolB-like protein